MVKTLLDRAKVIAGQYPADREFTAVVDEIETVLTTLTESLEQGSKSSAPNQGPERSAKTDQTSVELQNTPALIPRQFLTQTRVLLQSLSGRATKVPWRKSSQALAGALFLAVLVWAVPKMFWPKLAFRSNQKATPSATRHEWPVQITTSPSGTTIRIDGQVRGTSNLALNLPEGIHQIEVSKPGYETFGKSFAVKSPANPVSVELASLPQNMRLQTDLETGSVWLDQAAKSELRNGEILLERIETGEHNVRVSGPRGDTSFSFEIFSGAPPLVKDLAAGSKPLIILVSSFAGKIHVYCNCAPAKFSLDGEVDKDMGAEGSEVDLPSGHHELTLKVKGEQSQIPFEVGPEPTLLAVLRWGAVRLPSPEQTVARAEKLWEQGSYEQAKRLLYRLRSYPPALELLNKIRIAEEIESGAPK